MCFSAEASFVAAAAVGSVGVLGLRAVREPRELVLATLPVAFAAHQLAEGLTWRQLDAGQAVCQGPSVTAWTVFAWALVPVWLALGVALVENDAGRRRVMRWLVAAGLATAPLWLWQATSGEVYARVVGGHLEYPMPDPQMGWLVPVYVLVALGAPVVSTHQWLRRLGLAGAVSALATVAVSLYPWPSLWCFAAAGLSVLIVVHLRTVSLSAGDRPAGPSPPRAGSPRRAGGPSR